MKHKINTLLAARSRDKYEKCYNLFRSWYVLDEKYQIKFEKWSASLFRPKSIKVKQKYYHLSFRCLKHPLLAWKFQKLVLHIHKANLSLKGMKQFPPQIVIYNNRIVIYMSENIDCFASLPCAKITWYFRAIRLTEPDLGRFWESYILDMWMKLTWMTLQFTSIQFA